MNKVICVQCREYVDYEIKDIEQKIIIKKEEVVYKEKVAYCKKCGEEVWVEELEEKNVLEPINIYCEKKGLISPRQIDGLLKKYNIGKRPLAQLLGWGEITITRFLEGQLPSKEYSNKLLELLNNPQKFKNVLKRNKNKITSVAYKKANVAVESCLMETGSIMLETLMSTYRCYPSVIYRVNSNRSKKEVVGKWKIANCYC